VTVDEDPVADDGLPLEDGADDQAPVEDIPLVVMAAMRDRMHARRLSSAEDSGHVQESLGSADDDVHVVDDGPDHCMIGRPVGHAPDGSVYVLVARISRYRYEQLRDGDVEMAEAFADGRDISFCAVYEVDGIVANIALVRRFRHGDDVPSEYLPPSPFLEFAEEDSPTDEFAGEDPPIDEPVADESEADGSGAGGSAAEGAEVDGAEVDGAEADGAEVDEDSATGDHFLIDEDALIDEPAPGRLRRAFVTVTGAARRQRRSET
jgi:hypothetical protein